MALETGEYLSESMADYITFWTTIKDLEKISKNHGYSVEMARKLAKGERAITESNKPLVLEIIQVSILNRNKRSKTLNQAHKKAVKFI